MPEPKWSPAPTFRNPYLQALWDILESIVIAGIFYVAIALVAGIFPEYPTFAFFFKIVRYGITIIFLGLCLLAVVLRFFSARNAAQAREASEQVVAALNEMKGQSPGQNIAEISTQEVAASLKNTNIG